MSETAEKRPADHPARHPDELCVRLYAQILAVEDAAGEYGMIEDAQRLLVLVQAWEIARRVRWAEIT